MVDRTMGRLFALLSLVVVSATCLDIFNEVYIKEEDGVTTVNYPMQLGRVFVQGEIKGTRSTMIIT